MLNNERAAHMIDSYKINVAEATHSNLKMQSFSRATIKLSQVIAREQRLSLTAFRNIQTSAAVTHNEAMPLPTTEKVKNFEGNEMCSDNLYFRPTLTK